ncbi:MAG: hypothetical protein NTV36_02235 [Candidatus Staskawiczbacteria bacterium]|nr:hypothetical protein [Candidatus Staskawiczbacteria bacterium]
MGIGTSLYGEKDYDKTNHTYTATEWFILFFLPIIPTGSYRVRRFDTKLTFTGFLNATTRYEKSKISLDKKQVITTYLFIPATIGLMFLFSILFPDYGIASIFFVPIAEVVYFLYRSERNKRLK